MLLIAIFEDQHKIRQCNLYTSYEAFYKDTFSPLCNIIATLELGASRGKTYADRKACLYDKAVEYSYIWGELYPISYGEIWEIDNYFYKYGKRYGLLKEFKENAIC